MTRYWFNFAISAGVALIVCVIVALFTAPMNLPDAVGILIGAATYLIVWAPMMVWLDRRNLKDRSQG